MTSPTLDQGADQSLNSALTGFSFDLEATFDRLGLTETTAPAVDPAPTAPAPAAPAIAPEPAPAAAPEPAAPAAAAPAAAPGLLSDSLASASTTPAPVSPSASADTAALERRLDDMDRTLAEQRRVTGEWFERLIQEVNTRIPALVASAVADSQRQSAERQQALESEVERVKGQVAALEGMLARLVSPPSG